MFLQQINQLMFSLRQFQVLSLIQRDSNLEQQIFSIMSLRGNVKTKDQLVEVFCFSHSQFSQVYYLYQLSLLVSVTSLLGTFLYTYTRLYRFHIRIQLIKFQNSLPNFLWFPQKILFRFRILSLLIVTTMSPSYSNANNLCL